MTGQAMTQPVVDHTLYHVSEAKPYKNVLCAGQILKIGDAHNPYFGFYEGARKYPVTLPDRTVVQVPAIKFLEQVRLGKLTSTQLPNIAAEVARHYVMLVRELVMEEIRLEQYVGAPSRQRCLYACETIDEARFWRQRIGAPAGTICSLACSGVTHRADATLLLGDSEPLSETRHRAHRYWRGEAGDKPEWETLFVGHATVTAIGL